MGRPKKEKPNHGNYYEIKAIVHDASGRKIRKSFYSEISKDDARDKAKQYDVEHQVATITGEQIIDRNISFESWARKWLTVYKKPNVSANTYKWTYENSVEKHLIPYFGKMGLNEILPITVREFYKTKSDLSESALHKISLCLYGIFESAIENDQCFKNPAKNVSYNSDAQKHNKKVYSDLQIRCVEILAWNAMPEIVLLLETGIRRGEMLGLKWNDINLRKETLSVNRSIAYESGTGVIERPPKWDSYRTIPLSKRAVAIMTALKSKSNDNYRNIDTNSDNSTDDSEKFIFSLASGSAQDPTSWSRKLKRFMQKTKKRRPKILPLTAHELRHTYGTYLRRHGVDIYTIQKVMGHKDINMTSEIYVHNEITPLREAMNID